MKFCSRNKLSGGYVKAYAFITVCFVIIGYGAYSLGQFVSSSSKLEQNTRRTGYPNNDVSLYTNIGGADLVERYPANYTDSPSNFPDSPRTTEYPATSRPTVTAPVQTAPEQQPSSNPVVTQTQAQAPVPTPTQSQVASPLQATATATSQVAAQQSQTQPVQPELETFTSTINKRVSFQVPTQSKIKENGSAESFNIIITTPDSKIMNIQIEKLASGCFDPVASFAIPPSYGIDYRIIHEQKEVTTINTYRAMRLHEEYGTYTGDFGLRGGVCIRSAVPTKVDIRSTGFAKNESAQAFNLFDQIFSSLKV